MVRVTDFEDESDDCIRSVVKKKKKKKCCWGVRVESLQYHINTNWAKWERNGWEMFQEKEELKVSTWVIGRVMILLKIKKLGENASGFWKTVWGDF